MSEARVKNKEIFYILALLLIIFISDKILVPLPAANRFFNYNMSQWGVSYEDGFIYRGLIGSLINSFNIGFTDYFVYCSLILLLVIFAISALWLIRIYKLSPGMSAFLFVLFLASQPSSLRWWKSYGMFGSMDMFLIIIAAAVIFFIVKERKHPMVFVVLSAVLSVIAMMINEYFIFIYMPLILSLMMYRQIKSYGRLRIGHILTYLIPVAAAAVFIFLNGISQAVPAVLNKSIRSSLALSFDIPHAYNLAYDNLYYLTLGQKIGSAIQPMGAAGALKLLITLALLVPSVFVFVRLFTEGCRSQKDKKARKFLLAAVITSLTPLLGVFLSAFYYMWIGYVILTLSVLLITLIFIDGDIKNAVLVYVKKNHIALGIIGIYNICLGTFYVSSSFGWLETMLEQLL